MPNPKPSRRIEPAQQSDIKAQLKELAARLRELVREFPYPPISEKLVDFAATAFERFLSGEAKSLDEAFGLKKEGRGRPQATIQNQKLAQEIVLLRLEEKKSWTKITDIAFSEGWDIQDLRTLQRVFKQYLWPLVVKPLSGELAERLRKKDRDRMEERLRKEEERRRLEGRRLVKGESPGDGQK